MIWYFDFISPYAYLQFKRLQSEGLLDGLRMTPILFAGILKSLGQRGPAEIPGKREFTYRQVCWLARRQQAGGNPLGFEDRRTGAGDSSSL